MPRPHFARSAEFDAKLLRMVNRGVPLRDVAAELGVSRSSVQRWAWEIRTGRNRAGGPAAKRVPPTAFERARLQRELLGNEPLPPGHPVTWQAIMLPAMASLLSTVVAARCDRLRAGGDRRRAVLARLAASGALAQVNVGLVDGVLPRGEGYRLVNRVIRKAGGL